MAQQVEEDLARPDIPPLGAGKLLLTPQDARPAKREDSQLGVVLADFLCQLLSAALAPGVSELVSRLERA
jgi:hypothetical protein